MVDTLRDEDDLKSIYGDGVFREHDAQKTRDLITSTIGVGGVMACQDVNPANLPINWGAFSWFTDSSDTKGLSEDLVQGHFTIEVGAAGVYSLDFSAGLIYNFSGWVQFAIVKNASSFIIGGRRRRSFNSGDEGSLDIVSGAKLAEGNTIGVAVRASAGSPIEIQDATFRAVRI